LTISSYLYVIVTNVKSSLNLKGAPRHFYFDAQARDPGERNHRNRPSRPLDDQAGRDSVSASSNEHMEAAETHITDKARGMRSHEYVAKGDTSAISAPKWTGDCSLDTVKPGSFEAIAWHVSCDASMALISGIHPRLLTNDQDWARSVMQSCRPYLGAGPAICRTTALATVRRFRSEDRTKQAV